MPFTSPNSALPDNVSGPRSARCCAACGVPMADSLGRLGSIRCHDCRDTDAPIHSQLPVEPTTPRELAYRSAAGLEVTLLWFETRRCVAVRVFDSKTGDRFELPVDAADALNAFHHPFAYVTPRRRSAARTRSRWRSASAL
jgi:hypothetical protein